MISAAGADGTIDADRTQLARLREAFQLFEEWVEELEGDLLD